MIVYVVLGGFYENYSLQRIFASKDKAESYIASEMAKYPNFDAGKSEYYDLREISVD